MRLLLCGEVVPQMKSPQASANTHCQVDHPVFFNQQRLILLEVRGKATVKPSDIDERQSRPWIICQSLTEPSYREVFVESSGGPSRPARLFSAGPNIVRISNLRLKKCIMNIYKI